MSVARSLAPLNAAGFVTAFGAHSVASGLGAENHNLGFSLLSFAILLAVYDGAEVVLKPVFGVLSDRIGTKPVIVGGLVAFAVVSLAGLFATNVVLVGIARLGQGAAASAFSPAASSTVARLAGPHSAGRFFGRYGSWKSLGYAAGPLIAGGLISTLGLPALFLVLAGAAALTATWVAIAAPSLPVLARQRFTVADLARQLIHRNFLVPVTGLAMGAAALGASVGFLPVAGERLGLGVFGSVAAVTVLAVASAVAQRLVGHILDGGRLTTRTGLTGSVALIAASLAVEAVFHDATLFYIGAVLLGIGTGAATSLGFAQLATTTPPDRMGRTMGSAELGREVGDAGGPILVGAIAVGLGLSAGLGALAGVAAIAAGLVAVRTPLGGASVDRA